MSDIRTRLVKALRPWAYEPVGDHFADVLLALPGIAIIELPEPQATNGVKTDFGRFVEYWHHPPRERIERSITIYEAPTLMRAETARALAAALLAAANAAEESDPRLPNPAPAWNGRPPWPGDSVQDAWR